jgi:hypothetical protein
LEMLSDVAGCLHRIPIGFSAVWFKLIKRGLVKRLTFLIVCYSDLLAFSRFRQHLNSGLRAGKDGRKVNTSVIF